MKLRARFIIVLFIFICSSFLSQAVHAAGEDTIQFQPISQDSSGYVDISCDCYADALDIAQTGKSADQFTNAAKCKADSETINNEAWTQHTINSQAFAAANMMVAACVSNDPQKQLSAYNKSGLGLATSTIASLYTNPPASTTYYVADLMQNAGFAEPAYAQGIGYSGLMPLIDIWRLFRNFSYVILIAVAVIIGFMIMLRMNIDPQTVISVQNALPGIVITLILITFSYAIAGLLIDLMYFVTLLVVSIYGQLQGANTTDIAEFQQEFLNANAGTLFGNTVWTKNAVALPFELWNIFVPSTLAPGLILGFWGGGPAAWITGTVIAALPVLIIGFALFFAFLRILMILITSYIQILINIIFAPLILLRGALPGSNAFTGWLRTLVGNLLVYPATAGIILLSKVFTDRVEFLDDSGQQLWQPPFLLGPAANPDNLIGLIGLGIMLLAPTFILRIKNAIAEKPAVPVSPSIIVGPAASVVGRGIGLATTYGQLRGAGLLGQGKAATAHPAHEQVADTVNPPS